MDKQEVIKKFEGVAIHQAKFIYDNQAMDTKLTKQSAHLDHNLAEVAELREKVNDVQSILGQRIQANRNEFQNVAFEFDK